MYVPVASNYWRQISNLNVVMVPMGATAQNFRCLHIEKASIFGTRPNERLAEKGSPSGW